MRLERLRQLDSTACSRMAAQKAALYCERLVKDLASQAEDQILHNHAVIGTRVSQSAVRLEQALHGQFQLRLRKCFDGLLDLPRSLSPYARAELREVSLNRARAAEVRLAGHERHAKLRGQ